MKLSVCKIFEFSAAHHLPYHDGPCRNLHGHSYRLEIEVKGTQIQLKGPSLGMIIDYGDLSKIVKTLVLDELDHSYLNEKLENPTTENLVQLIKTVLQKNILFRDYLSRIRLWESSTSFCEWKKGEEI